MEDFETKENFHPNHTIIVWDYDDCQEAGLRSHFAPFGRIELFYVLPNPLKRFPNIAVVQYSIASEASSALHGILAQPDKKIDVRQPWAGGFSKLLFELGLTPDLLLEQIAKTKTVVYEVLHPAAVAPRNTVELYRFGNVTSFNVRTWKDRNFVEIIYNSPLSASLAVIGNTSPLLTVMLAQQVSLDGTIHALYVKKSAANSTKYIYCKDKHKPSPKIHKSILEAYHFSNPTPKFSQFIWHAPDYNQLSKLLDPLILQADRDNKLFFRAKFRIDGNTTDVNGQLTNDGSSTCSDLVNVQTIADTTDLPCFDIQIMFDVLNRNVLEDKVFLFHHSGTFDITNDPHQGNGHSSWLSLFELRIAVKRELVDGCWILRIDANVAQVNKFFHTLLHKNRAFSKVKPDTFLAVPIIESQEEKNPVPLSGTEATNYGKNVSGYEDDEEKYIIQLVARSQEIVTAFSIPIVAYKSVKVPVTNAKYNQYANDDLCNHI